MTLIDREALREEVWSDPDVTVEVAKLFSIFIDAAPTVCCERCKHHKPRKDDMPSSWCFPVGYHKDDFGCTNFKEAQP